MTKKIKGDEIDRGAITFIKYCYYFFVITLPLQWISFLNLGTLSFKPVHITIIFLLLFFLLFQQYRQTLFSFINDYKLFIICYALYLILNSLYFVFSRTSEGSLDSLVKIHTYFLFFILFTSAITFLRKSDKLTNEAMLVVCSVIIFIGIVNYIYYTLGISFVAEIIDAVGNVNVSKLQFQIYNRIFNYNFAGDLITKGDEEFLGAPLRNTLMGVFIMYFLILKVNQNKNHSSLLKFLIFLIILIIFFLIATSLSRSNLLSLFIIILIGYFSLHNLLHWNYAKLFTFTACILIIILFSNSLANVFETIMLRLESIQGSERVDLYDTAFLMINEKPIGGHGYSASIDTGIHEHQAHNLFLNAWMRLGIFGLILTLFYYGYILFQNLRLALYKEEWQLDIPSKWVMCFTVLPLFRALVSSTGDFTMIEWASLAYFFSYLHLNQRQIPSSQINKIKSNAS